MEKLAQIIAVAQNEADRAYANAAPEDAAAVYFETVTEARDLLTALEVIAYGNDEDQDEFLAMHGWDFSPARSISKAMYVASQASAASLKNPAMADAHNALRNIRYRTPEFLRDWLRENGRDDTGTHGELIQAVAEVALQRYIGGEPVLTLVLEPERVGV